MTRELPQADLAEPPCVSDRAPQLGRLELELARDGATTRPVRVLAQPPFQLSRVRYDDSQRPDMPVFTLLHLGGVLSGDQANLHVELGTGAAGRVRMAAATQVYRMPVGDAAHSLEINLAPGSTLEWLAEPLILFGGASFTQTTRIILGAGARLVLLDIVVPGRLARGEQFAFRRYTSRLTIENSAGQVLVAERVRMEPERVPAHIPGVLGPTPVVGSLYLLGGATDPEYLHSSSDPLLGVTKLPNDAGILVRALGVSGTDVRERLLAKLPAET